MITKTKNIIAVGSGKGGVGKSTVCCLIALDLFKRGYKVAIADLDIYGPSIPHILNVTEKVEGIPETGIIPPKTIDGIQVFSDEIFMNNKSTAVLWRNDRISKYILNTLENINWGKELDYLLLDLPPGTGESSQSFISFAKENKIKSGIVFASTPQDVSLNDVRKAITMANKLKMPIIGIVENTNEFKCPNCKIVHKLFGEGKVLKLCNVLNIKYLGSIPLISELSICCDYGLSLKNIPEEINKSINLIVSDILKFYEE